MQQIRMSINRKRYLIEPIDIQVTDNGKFADMAFFFDQENVLKKIADLRKSWIDNKTIPNEDQDDYFNIDRNLKETRHFWNNYQQVFQIAKKYQRIQKYKKIVLRYPLGLNYIRAITSAVLTGRVTDKDYTTVLREYPMENTPDFLQLNGMIAFTTGRLRKADVVLLNEDNKSISTVKRDRGWYLLYQKMGYRKIAQLSKVRLTTVISAINSYISKLGFYYSVTK